MIGLRKATKLQEVNQREIDQCSRWYFPIDQWEMFIFFRYMPIPLWQMNSYIRIISRTRFLGGINLDANVDGIFLYNKTRLGVGVMFHDPSNLRTLPTPLQINMEHSHGSLEDDVHLEIG